MKNKPRRTWNRSHKDTNNNHVRFTWQDQYGNKIFGETRGNGERDYTLQNVEGAIWDLEARSLAEAKKEANCLLGGCEE